MKHNGVVFGWSAQPAEARAGWRGRQETFPALPGAPPVIRELRTGCPGCSGLLLGPAGGGVGAPSQEAAAVLMRNVPECSAWSQMDGKGWEWLQEKLHEEVEVCLLLGVPVLQDSTRSSGCSAVPGQTKFSSSCAKSR